NRKNLCMGGGIRQRFAECRITIGGCAKFKAGGLGIFVIVPRSLLRRFQRAIGRQDLAKSVHVSRAGVIWMITHCQVAIGSFNVPAVRFRVNAQYYVMVDEFRLFVHRGCPSFANDHLRPSSRTCTSSDIFSAQTSEA